jgi:hypothetical protein
MISFDKNELLPSPAPNKTIRIENVETLFTGPAKMSNIQKKQLQTDEVKKNVLAPNSVTRRFVKKAPNFVKNRPKWSLTK